MLLNKLSFWVIFPPNLFKNFLFRLILKIYFLLLCSLNYLIKSTDEGCLKFFIRGRPLTFYSPSSLIEEFRLSAPTQPPSERLKLEWAYPLLDSHDFFYIYTYLYFHECNYSNKILLWYFLLKIDPFSVIYSFIFVISSNYKSIHFEIMNLRH